MTLKELYAKIDGDYDKAMQVLCIEKLLDKHIRKIPDNHIFADLGNAGHSMDENAIFESAHAIKGVCANLGLVKLADMASEITEEFRPGHERKMTDDEIQVLIDKTMTQFSKTAEGIKEYEQTN